MADKIVAEYNVEVDLAVKNLNKVANSIDRIDKERKETQDGFKSMSKSMVNDFKKVGAAIGIAFGAQELISFGKEAVKVASQAEGIRTAFARLNRPDLLSELRKATRGAVDDITLMRQAIRAQNFKVPLEQLGKFFDFATQRSIQTGESVDYLVNSIIDGIGRKSTLVLDNLGISATELQEEMKKTGDFGVAAGNIIARELEKAGEVADTTAIRLGRINTALDNMKVVAGEALINFGTGLLYLAGQIDTGTDATDGIAKAAENLADIYENNVVGAVDKMLEKNKELLANQLKIAELEETRGYQNSREAINNINQQIEKIEERNIFLREYIKQLKAIYDESQKEDAVQKEVIKNLFYYNDLIKRLKDEQADANTTRARVRELEDEINEAIRQRLILLGKLREVGGETYQEIESSAITELQVEQQLTDDLIDEANRRDDEIKKIKDSARLYDLQQEQEAHERRLQLTQETLSAIGQLSTTISQIVQNQITADLQALQKQFEEGEITREEFEQKQRELQRKSAQAAKDAALFNAVINTAQAVMQALANVPPPASYALAAVAGALGAAQIAAIASQPLPQFAEGGFVNQHGEIIGRSHAQGGVLIEAEGNEFITKGKYAQQNADILKAINSGDWEKYKMENIIAPAINQVLEGGFGGLGASYMLNTNWTDKNLLKQGDRNRYAMRDGFVYLGKEIRSLKGNQSRWN